ncbi:hypothetical protein XBO1_1010001 [Xenorhabdus bovienii str. oregonense]|uniref:Uncharacterized protein n=1 Tax=Xenorhabdus bovienii str. oregonense TaxID=1398202 RepID=A0A077P074_XENBV|nr:hypothetical protein XBO1_1010001 [Xenorhabdus bovienii str. oregonense]
MIDNYYVLNVFVYLLVKFFIQARQNIYTNFTSRGWFVMIANHYK